MTSQRATVMAAALVAVVGAVGWLFLLNPPDRALRADVLPNEMGAPPTKSKSVPESSAVVRRIEARPFESDEGGIENATPEGSGTIVFKIVDAANAPIVDARVLMGRTVSPKSDAAGMTKILLEGNRPHFFVASAPGYRPKEMPLPARSANLIEVRLERAAALLIRVRHEDSGISIEGTVITVAYEVDRIARLVDSKAEFRDVRGSIPIGGMTMFAGGLAPGIAPSQVSPETSGRHTSFFTVTGRDVLIGGFKKGDAVEVHVADRFGSSLIVETFVFDEDDTKPVELILRSRPRAVTVSVLDATGRTIPETEVSSAASFGPDPVPFRAQAGAKGTFEVSGIFSDAARINVLALGFIPKHVVIDANKAHVEVRLDRARELSGEIVGSARRFVGTIVFEAEGVTYTAEQTDDGRFLFSAIPARAGTLRATNESGRATSVRIGAEDSHASIQVPE